MQCRLQQRQATSRRARAITEFARGETINQNAGAGSGLRVHDIHHRFGRVWALNQANLDVAPGEFLALLGPSGSGKTTLLRIIAGLIKPTGGKIHIDDIDVTNLPPNHRNMGIVFQNYALFPHLTASENVAFPLEMRKLSADQVQERLKEALALVELGNLGDRYPGELSGGQQQRVALARAIVFRPNVLLMDEPLGSLDRQLRERMQIEVRRLQCELGITTIYVTHDQQEAFSMADRIAVMRDGTILQCGSPRDIYHSPQDQFIAEFVGYLNSFKGNLERLSGIGGTVHTEEGMTIPVQLTETETYSTQVSCGIRPENIQIGPIAKGLDFTAEGKVGVVTFQGTFNWVEVDLPQGKRILLQFPDTALAPNEGQQVLIGWNKSDVLVY